MTKVTHSEDTILSAFLIVASQKGSRREDYYEARRKTIDEFPKLLFQNDSSDLNEQIAKKMGFNSVDEVVTKAIQLTDMPFGNKLFSTADCDDKEFDKAAIKIIRAYGIPYGDLAQKCFTTYSAIAKSVSSEQFSHNTRLRLTPALAKYGDFDTPEKIIEIAKNLEPLPDDIMLYRASVAKLIAQRDGNLDSLVSNNENISEHAIQKIRLPYVSISETKLRRLPQVVGCTSMAEVIEKAGITEEELKKYVSKTRNKRDDLVAQELINDEHISTAMPTEQIATHAQRR